MGIMSGMLRPQASASWPATDDRWFYPGGAFYGDIAASVGQDQAMRIMTVYNCAKVLYNCVSQMPCHLMQEVDGMKSKAKDDYRYKLLGKRPNSWMTAPNFWGMAVVNVSLRGNFYAFKFGLEGGKVYQLIPIPTDSVTNVEQNKDYSITYHIKDSKGVIRQYPQSRIMHIRGMYSNGVVGINPIEYARGSLGLSMSSEKFLSQYFAKGVQPSAVIKHPLALNASAYSNMRAVFKKKYEGIGSDQNRGFMFLDEGMDIIFPPIKLVDAQFLELGRFNEAQICGMFGVPLIMVQAGDTPATYASSSQFKQSFVDFTLAPIAVNFETSIDRDLLTESEQDRLYSKFNMGSLLRGNMAERFAAYSIGINTEFLSPNEARSLEDLNRYDGGDEYRTRTSTVKRDSKADESGAGSDDDKEDNENET